MIRTLLITAALGLAMISPAASADGPGLMVEPYAFKANNGTVVEAERGTFEVPENRAVAGSRKIKISFVRFKATTPNPGTPIVYLAGGPGGAGTGTAQGARFPIFMALREVADVIAYDQRGTGLSNQIPPCKADFGKDTDQFTREAMVSSFRREVARCFGEWEAGGIDIDGYTTRENAADLEDLRKALGVPKINLWGISYGSHLGLTFMKYHRDSIDRVVLSGIEGLDQTLKRPALTDELFGRVQTLIDADPAAKAAYPDLAGLMRRVHAKLDAEPPRVTFTPKGAAAPVTITFDSFAIQLLVGGMISDPPGIARVPGFYMALDQGKYDAIAPGLRASFNFPAVRGMPEAMDVASGATAKRLALVQGEAKTAILGDVLNFPMPQLMGVRPSLDLGDEFRAPFASDVPGLFISATLDGRTYIPEAREEISRFTNKTHLIVENGGHNIYEADQRVADAVVAFFKGQPVPASIRMDPPVFAKP
jgi:pimeloyl-ACP methyl ester carboxylesterase